MNLSSEIAQFSRASLRKTDTVVTRVDGTQCVETRDDDGCAHSRVVNNSAVVTDGYVVDFKPDLHVGYIMPNLLLGAVDLIHDLEILESNKVTHILNVTTMAMEDFPEKFNYKHVALTDLPETDISASFDECFSFIDSARQGGGCVLVHCMAGISRSASIVIGYLMKNNGWTFDAAFSYVKQQRPSICPNEGFQRQLRAYSQLLGQKNTLANTKTSSS